MLDFTTHRIASIQKFCKHELPYLVVIGRKVGLLCSFLLWAPAVTSLVPRLHPSRNFVPTGSLVSNLTWGRQMISVRGHDQRSRPNLPTHMRSVRHSLAVRGDQGL